MSRGAIHRDVGAAAAGSHDAVVIGAGIYGACVALEAGRRGRRVLLLERDDFGGGVSRASLRIVHGGLRYLQSLDVARSRESAREQAWFLSAFPDLVRALPCILPLDGRGLRRGWAFRSALAAARVLGHGPPGAGVEPRPGVLAPAEAARWLGPLGIGAGRPAGVWHDAAMVCPERLLIEIIRWACACGATALNYVEATGLLTDSKGAAAGVRARDLVTGADMEFRAPAVINCAGPSCRDLAGRLDRDHAPLFAPSLAFNLLLDVPPPGPAAVAVRRRAAGARTYFLVPCHGMLMAGTFHDACDPGQAHGAPTAAQVARFLADLRAAAPGLNLPRGDAGCVAAVVAGLLPARAPGTPHQAERPRTVHHADLGGPAGLWSISGVKYTTARAVAERAVRRALPARGRVQPQPQRPAAPAWPRLLDPAGPSDEPGAAAALRRLERDESVVHLDDLVLRRTAWGLVPARAMAAGRAAAALLGWDEPRREAELRRLARVLGLPAPAPLDRAAAPASPARPAPAWAVPAGGGTP